MASGGGLCAKPTHSYVNFLSLFNIFPPAQTQTNNNKWHLQQLPKTEREEHEWSWLFFCFHIFVGKFLGSLLRVLLLLYAAFYGTSFATRKHFKTRSGKLLTAGKWANGPNQRRVPPTASCLLRARAVWNKFAVASARRCRCLFGGCFACHFAIFILISIRMLLPKLCECVRAYVFSRFVLLAIFAAARSLIASAQQFWLLS